MRTMVLAAMTMVVAVVSTLLAAGKVVFAPIGAAALLSSRHGGLIALSSKLPDLRRRIS